MTGMTPGSQRPGCATCLRPCASCICRWITPVGHAVELLILQHPMEVRNAKGSARLLHLCLPHSKLVVGERFAPAELAALLAGKNNLLLYPDTADARALGMPAPPPLEAGWLAQPASLRLVVLDGTWRKSRKMLYLNPQLQTLARLPLRATSPSHYLIRKAQAPDQLSTLEASAYALMQLEQDSARFQPLIVAFDGFVAQVMAQHSAAAGAAPHS